MNRSAVPKTCLSGSNAKVTEDQKPKKCAPEVNEDPLSNLSLGEKQGVVWSHYLYRF